MKNLLSLSLFLLFASLSLTSCAVSIVGIDEPVTKIYNVPGNTQDEIYIKVNQWMVHKFVDAKSVIQFSDKESGTVIGKYLMYGGTSANLYGTQDNSVYSIIDVRAKNDVVKITITAEPWRYDGTAMTIYNFSKEDALNEMNSLAYDLQKAIQVKNTVF